MIELGLGQKFGVAGDIGKDEVTFLCHADSRSMEVIA
jgi:hypothetical protein